jgi:hypothetical protein
MNPLTAEFQLNPWPPTPNPLPEDPRRHPIQGDHIDDLVNWQLTHGRGH